MLETNEDKFIAVAYPESIWRVIAQLSRVGRDRLLVVSNFYVTYQKPYRFKSVHWTHNPDPEKLTKGKSYTYDSGHDHQEHHQRRVRDLCSTHQSLDRGRQCVSKNRNDVTLCQAQRCIHKGVFPISKDGFAFRHHQLPLIRADRNTCRVEIAHLGRSKVV